MTRLAAYALYRWRVWRASRSTPPAIRELSAQLEQNRKAHKPTRHILAQMQRIRIDNLRAFKEANHA